MAASTTPPGSPPAPCQQRRRGRSRVPTPLMPPPNYHASLRYATSQIPQPPTPALQPGTGPRAARANAGESSATAETPGPPLLSSSNDQWPPRDQKPRAWQLDPSRPPRRPRRPPFLENVPLTSARAALNLHIRYGDHAEESVGPMPQSGQCQIPARPAREEMTAYLENLPNPIRDGIADYMIRDPAAARNAIEVSMKGRAVPIIEEMERDLRRARTPTRTQLRELQERDERLEGRRGLYRPIEDTAFGATNVFGAAQNLEAARMTRNMEALRATRVGDQQTRAAIDALRDGNGRQDDPNRATMAHQRRRFIDIPDISSHYESAFGLAPDGFRASRCPACTDNVTDETGAFLPECGHKWHIECLNRCFKVALSSKQHFPPRCCRSVLHRNKGCIDYEAVKKHLDDDVVVLWNERAEEWLSKDPTYCQTKGCTGGFISQAQIESGSAHCLVCKQDMCVECKAPSSAHIGGSHPNMLSEEDEALMEEKKWKQCPNLRCRKVLERTDGCDHMTCSECGEQFCYRCGQTQSPASVGCTCLQGFLPAIFRARELRPNVAGRTFTVDGPRGDVNGPGPMGGPLAGNREHHFQYHIPVQRAPRTPFSSRAPSPTRHRFTRDRDRLHRHLDAHIAEARQAQERLDQDIHSRSQRSEELRRLERMDQDRLEDIHRQTGGGRAGGHA